MADALISRIRQIVDPLILRLRQELYGSNVTYGTKLQDSVIPDTVLRGMTTYEDNTLVASEQKELNFVNASVSSTGAKTTVTMDTPLSDLLTNDYDLLTRIGSVVQRFGIGPNGTILSVASGAFQWVDVESTSPMTTAGDMIVGGVGGVMTRLPIGVSGYILMVVNGFPQWVTASGIGGGGSAGDGIGGILYLQENYI